MIGMALLGCGRIGKVHAHNLARHPAVKLECVYDVMTCAAESTARDVGTRCARSVDEVMADPAIQAVLIATSTDTHVALIIAAAHAHKAVLCEKPIDLDLARAKRCWNDIASLQPTVMIGFNRRFDPSFRSLRERLGAGEIGVPELVIITSRDPAPPPVAYIKTSGGIFRDMTIHDFDMARYLLGDILELQAFGANLVDPAIGELGDIDTAMLVLRARSGALVHIDNSRRCVYGYDQRIEVFGSKGMLRAGNQHATTVESWNAASTRSRDLIERFFIERYAAAYAAEIDYFAACVRDRKTPSPSFADGISALELAEAAVQSLHSARTVQLS
ncbi:MAG: inositol 2-dehydrogenase [Gammaproteobacteria bacterium]|nr:MAG: inositol 2-dehydrogenase [Gammaproteobacteria bacterium]